MSTIKAVTNDNNLIITSRPSITSGSKNVNELSVVFDKSWNFDSAEYFVNFYTDSDENGVIRKFTLTGSVGKCAIPYYATEKEGFFHFGVFAKADGDIIKTSDIAGYEVEKGVCIKPTGDEHDTSDEIRRRFIDLMNANMSMDILNYNMRFEDIDANYTGYMNQVNVQVNDMFEMSDALFELAKSNVDSEITESDDPMMTFLIGFSALEEYFRNVVIQLDSMTDELESLNSFKSAMLNLIHEYIDSGFDSSNDIALYSDTIEEYVKFSDAAIENNEILYNGINEMITQEE